MTSLVCSATCADKGHAVPSEGGLRPDDERDSPGVRVPIVPAPPPCPPYERVYRNLGVAAPKGVLLCKKMPDAMRQAGPQANSIE